MIDAPKTQEAQKERTDILPEVKSGHPTPMQAAVMLIALVPIIGLFMIIGSALGAAHYLFVGFVFILYWTGMKAMQPEEFAPALLGCLGGLGLAYLLHVLPAMMGMAGMIIAAAGVAIAVYLLILGRAGLLINNAFMLLLTLGNPIVFERDADFATAAIAIVAAAIYAGGLVLLITRFSGGLRTQPE